MNLRKHLKNSLGETWLNPNYLTKALLCRVLLEAKEYAGGVLLDIGCGKKPYLPLFSTRVREYIGINVPSDFDPLCDVYGDALNLPFKSEVADTVLCTQVLEHVCEPNRCIAEISRVLRKGGYLILTAPQTWGLHEQPHDYWRFTKYGLRHLAEKNGLEVEYIRPDCGTWSVVGQLTSEFVSRYGIVAFPICAIVQLASYALDIIVKRHGLDTLNNIMVARKL